MCRISPNISFNDNCILGFVVIDWPFPYTCRILIQGKGASDEQLEELSKFLQLVSSTVSSSLLFCISSVLHYGLNSK